MAPAATETKLEDLLSEHPSLSNGERHDVAEQLQANLIDLARLLEENHWMLLVRQR